MKSAALPENARRIITIFIFLLLKGNLFAGRAELEMIKAYESQEKQPAAERIIRPNIEYKAERLRDPFEGPSVVKRGKGDGEGAEEETQVVAPTPPPVLTVQGLVWGGVFPQAIINDSVVEVGDTIQGAKIITITKEGVTVLFEGRQHNLPSPAGFSRH